MKDKKMSLYLYNFLAILFIELVFRIVTINHFFTISLIYVLVSSVLFSIAISWVCGLFPEKANRVVYRVLLFIVSLWATGLLIYKNVFDVFFSLAMLKLADQVMSFWKDAIDMILNNFVYIIIIFIPFIVSFILRKKISFERRDRKHTLIGLGIILLGVIGFKVSLLINKKVNNKAIYSAYRIFYKVNDSSLSIEKYGLYMSTYLDIKKTISNFQEEVNYVKLKGDEPEEEINYDYNDMNIDFAALANQTNDSTLKQMHEYFNSESGSKQNKYTGLFKDKNLILFMAESFNEIAVDKDITPTLYKLVNSSFIFDNFYTPVNNSTIGGEFQELTGLFANGSILKTWRSGANYFPFGIANVYKSMDYKTYAYHNHYYTFQDRNKYLKSLGFNNFLGCYNGLEKRINCKLWPESDVELINATVDDYINDDKFMVYYASVSGHGSYSWSNSMSAKHRSEVENLPYSESVKAYLATQIEFDQALKILIDKLEAAGKLEDTVIAIVGDHYPYMLTLDEMNEHATYTKDEIIEINRSNFILYNPSVEDTHITKVGSQIDVLPTIYNLFGVEYDSRLIIGKDILSTEPGLAIFNNRSWISDYGMYYANTKEFVLKDGKKVDSDYVDTMNQIVSNKINMSRLLIEKDYYRKVLGN